MCAALNLLFVYTFVWSNEIMPWNNDWFADQFCIHHPDIHTILTRVILAFLNQCCPIVCLWITKYLARVCACNHVHCSCINRIMYAYYNAAEFQKRPVQIDNWKQPYTIKNIYFLINIVIIWWSLYIWLLLGFDWAMTSCVRSCFGKILLLAKLANSGFTYTR